MTGLASTSGAASVGGALGVVLAAGQGRRMGCPKALLQTPEGRSWAARAAMLLSDGGCRRVLVTVGAAADAVRATLPPDVTAVAVPNYRDGVGAGVRVALQYADGTDADLVVFLPVDLPDLTAGDVRAVLVAAALEPTDALVRAGWQGRGGHPVAVGRTLWAAAITAAVGDTGLRQLFDTHPVVQVQCPAAVADVDTPEGMPPGTVLP